MRFLLLTGLSGAGKTSAMRSLEDMGVFCVDNLPPMMMIKFMEACETSSMNCPMVAFAVDVRSGAFFDAQAVCRLMMETQPLGYKVETLFLEASDEVLLARYKETRREHPLAGDSVTLTEAIAAERGMVQPLREMANYVIDTSALRGRDLKKRLEQIVHRDGTTEIPFRVEVMSFGFKRGLPRQADLVYDVRFLPNPFYIPELCRHSGQDEDVRRFVMEHPVTQEFVKKTEDLLDFLLPHYREEGKHRLVIAVGCTGGAHRSVAIAEALGAYLQAKGNRVVITHRDMDVEQAHWLTEPAK